MDKIQNIFYLHSQLNNDGSKTSANNYAEEIFELSPNSFKTNYLQNKRFPKKYTEPKKENYEEINSRLDKFINYLQNALKNQNSL